MYDNEETKQEFIEQTNRIINELIENTTQIELLIQKLQTENITYDALIHEYLVPL